MQVLTKGVGKLYMSIWASLQIVMQSGLVYLALLSFDFEK